MKTAAYVLFVALFAFTVWLAIGAIQTTLAVA
jgi:hypothetical protein